MTSTTGEGSKSKIERKCNEKIIDAETTSRPMPCCRLPKEPKFVLVDKSKRDKVEKVSLVDEAEDTEKNVGTTDNNRKVVEDNASSKCIPIIEKSSNRPNPSNVAVPRDGSSRAAPSNVGERPLVIAAHLVPSLPIALFEIIADVIEVATDKPVSLLSEPRYDRPVAKDLVDIAILPASDTWNDGYLLPVSFVFDHRCNKNGSPAVYVDVIVAPDCVRNVEEIIDLRGYRCALPDRCKTVGAAGLLFAHLKSKGENPMFFGNTLDSGSQVAALQMVAGNQADVGVLESPVINYHRRTLPGVDALFVLASLGPLPPYRIMINKNIDASLRDKIKESLLNVDRDVEWMERLKPYGVSGFAEYSEDRYDIENVKNVVTSVPYY